MKMNWIVLVVSFFCVQGFGPQGTAAQFPIKIPRIKIDKPKTEQPKSEDSSATTPAPINSTYSTSTRKSQYDFVRPTAQPLFVKDSIYIQAETHDEYWKTPTQKTSSWVPMVKFSVFYDWQVIVPHLVEYFNPDGSLWFSEILEGDRPTADGTVPFKSSYSDTKRCSPRNQR